MFDKTEQNWEIDYIQVSIISADKLGIEADVNIKWRGVSYSVYHGKATPEHLDKLSQLTNQNRLFSIQEIESIFTP
jgi:hypothetical protein